MRRPAFDRLERLARETLVEVENQEDESDEPSGVTALSLRNRLVAFLDFRLNSDSQHRRAMCKNESNVRSASGVPVFRIYGISSNFHRHGRLSQIGGLTIQLLQASSRWDQQSLQLESRQLSCISSNEGACSVEPSSVSKPKIIGMKRLLDSVLSRFPGWVKILHRSRSEIEKNLHTQRRSAKHLRREEWLYSNIILLTFASDLSLFWQLSSVVSSTPRHASKSRSIGRNLRVLQIRQFQRSLLASLPLAAGLVFLERIYQGRWSES